MDACKTEREATDWAVTEAEKQGFRPLEAQEKLWKAKPDPNYVSNPKTGKNTHSRGNTVDLTLVDAEGKPIITPIVEE